MERHWVGSVGGWGGGLDAGVRSGGGGGGSYPLDWDRALKPFGMLLYGGDFGVNKKF